MSRAAQPQAGVAWARFRKKLKNHLGFPDIHLKNPPVRFARREFLKITSTCPEKDPFPQKNHQESDSRIAKMNPFDQNSGNHGNRRKMFSYQLGPNIENKNPFPDPL